MKPAIDIPLEPRRSLPVDSGQQTQNADVQAALFGAFAVRRLFGVGTTPQTVAYDAPSKYVTVYGDGQKTWVQLGSSLDVFTAIPNESKHQVRLPRQGVQTVTVKSDTSTCDITLVFHDDPIKIWG